MEINLEHKVAMALERAGLPRKPAYTQPCNGCVLCCTLQLCHVADQREGPEMTGLQICSLSEICE